jgi:hypothetical protein
MTPEVPLSKEKCPLKSGIAAFSRDALRLVPAQSLGSVILDGPSSFVEKDRDVMHKEPDPEKH